MFSNGSRTWINWRCSQTQQQDDQASIYRGLSSPACPETGSEMDPTNRINSNRTYSPILRTSTLIALCPTFSTLTSSQCRVNA
jgi:hypothetical protein